MSGSHRKSELRATALRAMVGRCDFTIVSNNCWGSHIYQALGLSYRTPFVGLFITPDSYLKLVRRFDRAMGAELLFTSHSQYPGVNAWRQEAKLSYPIGILDGDIEINFQHYASQAEARSKWFRRVDRMVHDPMRCFFKFDDRERADRDDIETFCALPLANKVCFSASPHASSIVVPSEPGKSHVVDGVTLSRISRRYFNTLRWISTLPVFIPLPSLL